MSIYLFLRLSFSWLTREGVKHALDPSKMRTTHGHKIYRLFHIFIPHFNTFVSSVSFDLSHTKKRVILCLVELWTFQHSIVLFYSRLFSFSLPAIPFHCFLSLLFNFIIRLVFIFLSFLHILFNLLLLLLLLLFASRAPSFFLGYLRNLLFLQPIRLRFAFPFLLRLRSSTFLLSIPFYVYVFTSSPTAFYKLF